jgi:hypothetical protein
VPRLTSRLKSPVSPLIGGLILARRRLAIGNVCGASLRSRLQLAPSEAAEDAGYPESQNGAEAYRKYDDPPNPGRKAVHGRRVPPGRTEAMLRSRWLELGIAHRYEEFPDNHSGVDYRMDESLPFLAQALVGGSVGSGAGS